MSYSFTVRAATKAEAKERVAAELEKVVASQSCHAADKAQAQAVADSFIDVLPDDDSKDVLVSMNGYVSGNWEGSTITRITSASVNVSVGLSAKEDSKV